MSGQKGDYIGFSFNGRHSSEFNIVRVSNGSRFDENLLPTIKDKTVEVPGRDGVYYFGSQYTQRQFKVDFAFDAMTEQNLADLRAWLGNKGIHDLIFDETPYKVYSAKATGTATAKYLVFEERDNPRVYKGEGSIQFTCYYPFARCRFDSTAGMDESVIKNVYPNLDEWWDASKLEWGGTTENIGDIPVPFQFLITTETQGKLNFNIDKNDNTKYDTISWNFPERVYNVTLNTELGLALGSDGKVYNAFFTGNLFSKLLPGKKQPNGLVFTPKYY